jgi:hypothetical protein
LRLPAREMRRTRLVDVSKRSEAVKEARLDPVAAEMSVVFGRQDRRSSSTTGALAFSLFCVHSSRYSQFKPNRSGATQRLSGGSFQERLHRAVAERSGPQCSMTLPAPATEIRAARMFRKARGTMDSHESDVGSVALLDG